ncbi:hypothetical protein K438DRAFT_1997510 [Mycena galopus ATCC 62051]|nr:hypothetical protein K438DRAFT_1997510 [Mycena galopus ATCC 62051]
MPQRNGCAVMVCNLWLIGGHTAADVFIAIVMTTLLLQASMNASTRLVAKDVVQVILETNIVSATVAMDALLLFVSCPVRTCFQPPNHPRG